MYKKENYANSTCKCGAEQMEDDESTRTAAAQKNNKRNKETTQHLSPNESVECWRTA